MPDGLPDTFGLWDQQTWWCELKVGKPAIKKLRPRQIEFGYECIRHHIPFYTCFGWYGRPFFYCDFKFAIEVVPPFYRPVAVA